MDNSTFNLHNQLTQEQKSLWRIKEFYLKDAQESEHKIFWEQLADQKEQTIARLQELIGS